MNICFSTHIRASTADKKAALCNSLSLRIFCELLIARLTQAWSVLSPECWFRGFCRRAAFIGVLLVDIELKSCGGTEVKAGALTAPA